MWNLPQFSGEPGNSPINIFSQAGEQNKYYYDICFSGSEDGGKNWIEPSLLVNVPHEANYWVNISGIVHNGWSGTSLDFNYIYYYDEIPGAAILGENSFGTNCTWKYNVLTPGIINVDDEDISAVDFNLMQNYPNPFNPSTVISYQLSVSGDVTLKVFDILGNEVATLVNELKPAGNYEVEFDASSLTSGVYFYKLQAGTFVDTKKMVLLK
ncbi:MAG: T9SS type A sorting domain-containing protein [bacterium]|nr:T9SS type A sorting domain-containing protein [bacterium]